MRNEDFEKWFNSYEQTGAFIIAYKEKGKGDCEVKIAGKNLEILYVFEEIVRKMHTNIDKEILRFVFETGLGDHNAENQK